MSSQSEKEEAAENAGGVASGASLLPRARTSPHDYFATAPAPTSTWAAFGRTGRGGGETRRHATASRHPTSGAAREAAPQTAPLKYRVGDLAASGRGARGAARCAREQLPASPGLRRPCRPLFLRPPRSREAVAAPALFEGGETRRPATVRQGRLQPRKATQDQTRPRLRKTRAGVPWHLDRCAAVPTPAPDVADSFCCQAI
eukprot:362412-Chlamydomonas_euryale.AAC.4